MTIRSTTRTLSLISLLTLAAAGGCHHDRTSSKHSAGAQPGLTSDTLGAALFNEPAETNARKRSSVRVQE